MPPLGVDTLDVDLGLDIGEGDNLPLTRWGDCECESGLPSGETGQEMFLATHSSLQR